MNISQGFIRKPIATAFLAIGITLIGVVAFFRLPVSALPSVDTPTIQVTAQLPVVDRSMTQHVTIQGGVGQTVMGGNIINHRGPEPGR